MGNVPVDRLRQDLARRFRPEAGGHRRVDLQRAIMLKIGDKVYIDGTNEEGTVKEVHPHEVLVRVKTADGHEDRKFANEALRRDPTMNEASNYIDH
jgi:hypothetical protein